MSGLPRFYTVKQIAEMLGFHEQTVRDDIRAGNLEVTRFGPRRTRVSESQLAAYIQWLEDYEQREEGRGSLP